MQIALKAAESLSLELTPGQILTSPRLDGMTVEAVTGSIWITFESEGVDHVLKPGERLRLGSGGKAVLEALEASRLTIRTPAPSPELRNSLRRVSDCLADLPLCTRNAIQNLSAHRFGLETL